MSFIILDPKIRILLLSATPDDSSPLKVDKEFKEIKKSLSYSENFKKYEIIQEASATIDDFSNYLEKFSPNIIHFSGHGESDGIYFENGEGYKELINPLTIVKYLNRNISNVECIILNSCYSEKIARILSKVVPCVIGTSSNIKDSSAIIFSKTFYDALSNDYSFSESFELSYIRLGAINEEDIPVLYKNGKKEKYISRKNKTLKSNLNIKRNYIKYSIYVATIFFIYVLSSLSGVYEQLSENFVPVISTVSIILLFIGLNSLEKVAPKYVIFVDSLVVIFKSKLLYYIIFIIFVFIPLTIYSSNIQYCHIKKYIYIKNLKKLSNNLKIGKYDSSTGKIIENLISSFPYRREAYALISWKSMDIRNNYEDEKFRSFNKFVIHSIYGEFPNKNHKLDFYKKKFTEKFTINGCSCSISEGGFSPLIFINRLYAQSSNKVPNDEDRSISKKILSVSINKELKSVYTLLLELENSTSLDIEKKLLKSLYSINDSSNKYSYVVQQSWDYLAQSEIEKCGESAEKEKNIEKIVKYYSAIVDSREKAILSNGKKILWFFPPEKTTLYWHILKWRSGNKINIPTDYIREYLTYWKETCPDYEKVLKNTLNEQYYKFVSPSSFKTEWLKGTLANKSIDHRDGNYIINEIIHKNWRF